MISNKKSIFIVLFLLSNFLMSCRTNSQEKEKMNGYKFTNKLVNEKSPYLQQHAHNPVDWYPWGEEAFEKAKKEDKPIFLSIGYSTCHWCHVMERESFEDTSVANLMNKYFVSIKVDREERPDIDNIYMTVCQMMTGHGGWPMTIIMTPDKKPFFAGTYFPKETRFGRIGLLELLGKVQQAWLEKRDEINTSANQITSYLKQTSFTEPGKKLDKDILDKTFTTFADRFDKKYGGFGNKPKFPTPHNLMFLLRYWHRTNNPKALEIVKKTLEGMRNGGIFDHIGFGFHRYSTDEKWLVPHFEKMLYDQALLSMAYIEAYQATGETLYKTTAEEVFDYVIRDMSDPAGGFYTAEDADSEGKEGKFYIWKASEIDKLLGDSSKIFKEYYGINENGNFTDEATKKQSDENILHITKSISQLAKKFNLTKNELLQKLENERKVLFNVREKRVHPFKDTKVLTDWNGLMIAALAKGGRVLNDIKYTKAAEKAAHFISGKLQKDNGELMHRYREGIASIDGSLDDYAFFIWGLLELYETTFNAKYLEKAIKLSNTQIEHFWDYDKGGFFFSGNDAEKLLIRTKEVYDGAVPSGNSVALFNLLRLGRLTADIKYEKLASELSSAFSTKIEKSPSAFTQFLTGEDFGFGPSFEILITGKENDPDTQKIIKELYKNFIPNKVVIFISEKNAGQIHKIAEFTKDYKLSEGKPAVYVCKNFVCNLPTTDSKKMLEMLSSK